MKLFAIAAAFLVGLTLNSFAVISIDDQAFGQSLGGWSKRSKAFVEYPLSGSVYRTYRPEVSPTPDGGIFISVRIDHVRGWLSSNDHANLEITVGPKGAISTAQSSVAIQGHSITSEVIQGGNEAGKALLSTDRAVQIGTDLIADLSAKLLRENIVEAGRVSFPAVLRHNYNRIFQAIRVDGEAVSSAPTIATIAVPATAPSAEVPKPAPAESEKPKEPAPSAPAAPSSAPLEIKPYS